MPCTRRQLVVDGPLAALGAFAAARLGAQAQPSAATPPAAPTATAPPVSPAPLPPTPVWTELRGRVGTFTAAGGTIGTYLGPESLVVVDTQVPDGAKLFLEGANVSEILEGNYGAGGFTPFRKKRGDTEAESETQAIGRQAIGFKARARLCSARGGN